MSTKLSVANGKSFNRISPDAFTSDSKYENDLKSVNEPEGKQISFDIGDESKAMTNLTVSWENIDVRLPQPGCSFLPCCKKEIKKDHILENVHGIAKHGQVLAIMGASGAGKTTLLNVLNFRNRGTLNVTGDVKINGQTITSYTALAAISGYVQQDELFIGTLQVREHLVFQAMLRMDEKYNKEQKMNRVDEVLNELNLRKCQDTLIGIPEKNVKGISGGERRRLAFASEIITNPGILFCDEPTSGLDSFMALSVVESMKNLASLGKTIICTIHQPSSEIFDKFDRLCLMAEGRLAFLGDLKDAMKFFSEQSYACPQNFNPSDFYIQTLAIAPTDREVCLDRVKKICDSFDTSSFNKKINAELFEANVAKPAGNLNSTHSKKSPYKVNIFVQLMWLVWRSVKSTARDVLGTQIKIIQTIFIAIIFGLIFLQVKTDQSGIMNANGLLFLLLTNASFSNMFSVINSFPAEIPILMREHKNGMYMILPYYLSKILVDLPFFIILPIISTSICYWMANLNNDAGRFLICCGIVILVSNIAVSFGGFISAVAPSTNVALGLSGPVLVPLMIFSGMFLNNDSVPSYFIWLKYLSWFNYSYESLVINQWQSVSNISCSTAASRCLNSGADVISYLSMKTVSSKNSINCMD